ncbi:MAG: hypothetical protein ACKOEO_00055 [Planctomycetaceae bacterium]
MPRRFEQQRVSLCSLGDDIRAIEILRLPCLLMQGLISEAGTYRPFSVKITTATYRPHEHFDLPRLMAEPVEILGRQKALGTVSRSLLGA